MNDNNGNGNNEDQAPYYGSESRIRWLVIRFTVSGVVVSALWLSIFVAGLLVDSSYYRAAISFQFAGLGDWIMAIITFTFSNVVLLAFMSGLLGGITSKMLYTKCFRISKKDYIEANTFQIESPAISAFRGMFVFIAILFMQYVSSFADLGAISKIPEEEQKSTEVKFEKLYSSIAQNAVDTGQLADVRKEVDKLLNEEKVDIPDSSLINMIIRLRTQHTALRKEGRLDEAKVKEKNEISTKIRTLRRTLKVPSNSDYSGIGLTSFSYFKFAVIVSFLAFMCGYDPSLFKVIVEKVLRKPGDKDPAVNP